MARILVIDDDDRVRHVIRRTLEREGHTLVEANDGAVGLQLLEGEAFDLVITDMLMPGTDGLEAIRGLRERGLDIPVLAISGGMTAWNPLPVAEAMGAHSSLAKPFELTELVAAVTALLAGSQTG